MKLWQSLRCLFGYHAPNQRKISDKSEFVRFIGRMIGFNGMRVGKSECIYCKKMILVKQFGYIGPGLQLDDWELATKFDLKMMEKYKNEAKENDL